MNSNPFVQFDQWYQEAQQLPLNEPTFVTLATADAQGAPSARTVLLKHYDEDGFVFYGNLKSRKMQQLQENPQVALLFYWMDLDRQIRIEGRVTQIADTQADAYFQSRARGSQLGAWASKQSHVIETPNAIEERLEKYQQRFEGKEVPRPHFWSGMRVAPHRFEFWRAGENRLHDRTRYLLKNNEWHTDNLYP
ncbi:MAG: pyridoxamine 5'-phosphate oxidase [Myxococcales bacterium]|nr:pyridoxamine 5'-phosphate oxidase [Myxococcales bacterium]|tara:strand:- start:2034 stop:2612 length:579 start_codon:yes stop_codon:yes gene_type:complete